MKNWLRAMGAAAALVSLPAAAQRVDGFGTNVPLSFAVRQIVPNDYLVRFEPGIDQSSKVTWSGSEDWQTVLGGLTSSKGLSYRVQGQSVIVGAGGAAQPVAVAPAASAPVVRVPSQSPVAAPVQAYSPPPASGGMRMGGLVVLPTRAAPPAAPVAAAPVVQVAPVYQSPAPEASLPPVVGSAPVAGPAATGNAPVLAPVVAPAVETPPVSPEPAPARVSALPEEPAPARDESRMTRRERERLRAAERAEARAQARLAARGGAAGAVTETRAVAPSASQAAPSARVSDRPGIWRAPRNETLNNVLGDWADRSGWTVVFTTRVVYELQAGAEFEGDFTEAAAALLRSVRAEPNPTATFYRGNKVLVVSDASTN